MRACEVLQLPCDGLAIEAQPPHPVASHKQLFEGHVDSERDVVERRFARLTEETLRRSSHKSTAELEDAIYEHIEATNDDPKPFIWTKTADPIIAAVARFCAQTLALADS